MKGVFLAMAQYNRSVNETLSGLLSGLSKDQMMMETKAFFHSIFETYMHIITTDRVWLRRYDKNQPGLKCLQGSRLMSVSDQALRNEIDADYRKVFDVRKQLDDLISGLIHELTGQDLIRNLQHEF